MSGRFGSERDGFRDIVARICMGEVGAVFGLDVSSFGRSKRRLQLAGERPGPGRRAPGGRWCIHLDPATQQIYRDKVAKSFRLKPTNLAANGDPGSDATHRDNYGR